MQPPTRSLTGATLALVLSLTATACLDQEVSSPIVAPEFGVVQGSPGDASDISVYTQNVFLGGDTGPLFSLDLTDTSPEGIGAVIQATNIFWAEVQASDIPSRAAEFVNEIESRQPDVVALQEAVGYATGTLSFGGVFTPSAGGPDLLLAVMTEIATRGLPYSLAAMQPTTAIALPIGPPGATGFPALAVQDRVVMFVHDDIVDYDTDQGIYAARLPLGPVDLVRGWIRLSTEKRGVAHHFVVTHLETQGSADPSSGIPYFIRQVHNGQAAELQGAVLAGLEGVTVVMGDLNSDAAADPSAPSYTDTYGNLVAAGFTDVWQQGPHPSRESGVTCCQEDGTEPRVPSERIDFVLFRSSTPWADNGNHRGYFRAEVIGSDEADRTPSGVWPSDHAGIVASLRLPEGMR
jgi:endonuclease/exonuclease/phosphatase family metal-dependent hydrolase